MTDDEKDAQLREDVLLAGNLAQWMYFDNLFDCDEQALVRTSERLNAVLEEHGSDALWGVVTGWAIMLVEILSAFCESQHKKLPTNLAPLLGAGKYGTDTSESRAKTTAAQFIGAVAVEDLEMSQDIFLAAFNSTDSDFNGFLVVVLRHLLFAANHYSV